MKIPRDNEDYRRTERKILTGLKKVLNKKAAMEVKVVEVCKKGEIRQGTFYNHYHGIGDLKNKNEQAVLEDFRAFMKKAKNQKSPEIIWTKFLLVLKAKQGVFEFLITANDYKLLLKMVGEIVKLLTQDWIKLPDELSEHIVAIYQFELIGEISEWMKKDAFAKTDIERRVKTLVRLGENVEKRLMKILV